MVRKEIQNFIEFVKKNKSYFKFSEHIPSNAILGASGITNSIYEANYAYIFKGNLSVHLKDEEQELMLALIQEIKQRDVPDSEAPFLEELNNLAN